MRNEVIKLDGISIVIGFTIGLRRITLRGLVGTLDENQDHHIPVRATRSNDRPPFPPQKKIKSPKFVIRIFIVLISLILNNKTYKLLMANE